MAASDGEVGQMVEQSSSSGLWQVRKETDRNRVTSVEEGGA